MTSLFPSCWDSPSFPSLQAVEVLFSTVWSHQIFKSYLACSQGEGLWPLRQDTMQWAVFFAFLRFYLIVSYGRVPFSQQPTTLLVSLPPYDSSIFLSCLNQSHSSRFYPNPAKMGTFHRWLCQVVSLSFLHWWIFSITMLTLHSDNTAAANKEVPQQLSATVQLY